MYHAIHHLSAINRPNAFTSARGLFSLLVLLAAMFAGCAKQVSAPTTASESHTLESIKVPAQFKYETALTLHFSVTASTGNGRVLKRVPIKIMNAVASEGGQLLSSGSTNENGVLEGECVLPTYADSVVVATDYIGLPSEVKVPVIGGYCSLSYETLQGSIGQPQASATPQIVKVGGMIYKFMGSWNGYSVPTYLESKGDIIDDGLLSRINATLPEQKSVPKYNPEYLDGKDKSTILDEPAEVWVSFVHEGAGYTNALGFYTYKVDAPPTSVSEIDTITIIFPNASYAGSGGGLHSGDKVKLGVFPANTAIGWVVISNGYSSGTVGSGLWKLFSNENLNPGQLQQTILLNDVGFDRVLLGLEDISRTSSSCDNDFNDVIFSITANPFTAIRTENLPITETPVDGDGDGVSDSFDAYPKDPIRAFDSYTPAQYSFSTLVFEDLWPGKGDYDFNDLVVDYNVRQVANAQNKVVEIKSTFVIKAVGASFQNGFGIQLPISPDMVASVKGTQLKEGMIKELPNGCEAGQSRAVIIAFDNATLLMKRPGGYYINSEFGAPYVQPETVVVDINFIKPVDPAILGQAPYNPFIFVNKEREKEVHLPDHSGTDLASDKYFGMFADDTRPSENRFYKTRTNLPWALNIAEQFDYPVEYSPISAAYSYFIPWAESNGAINKDWYKNNSGNRNTKNIYKR